MSSKSTTISITPELKAALEELKKDLSDKRKVPWNEVIETLLRSYHGKKMANIENKRLQHTITKIAVNQSKAGTYVTQQTLVPIQNNNVIKPPPPPHLCPPPQAGNLKQELCHELDQLFQSNNGVPKLIDASQARMATSSYAAMVKADEKKGKIIDK